jgi:demethylmenaquinone methyltransferase/2-methoxy-6-polyprenyl-1,4-benzoquinol methylase
VLLCFTLELFDTPAMPLVLGECRRVLRSSGRLCVVALASQGGSRPMLSLYSWAHARFPAWIDCRPILPANLLQDNGFHIQELIQASTWGLPVQVVLASRAP